MFKELKIDRLKTIETAIVISLVLLIIAWNYQDSLFIVLAFGILILSLVVPIVFYPFAKLWFGLGLLLGLVVTKILLTLIFLLIVTPVGIIRKLLGKDALFLKQFKKSKDSMFIIRDQTVTSDDLKNPF